MCGGFYRIPHSRRRISQKNMIPPKFWEGKSFRDVCTKSEDGPGRLSLQRRDVNGGYGYCPVLSGPVSRRCKSVYTFIRLKLMHYHTTVPGIRFHSMTCHTVFFTHDQYRSRHRREVGHDRTFPKVECLDQRGEGFV